MTRRRHVGARPTSLSRSASRLAAPALAFALFASACGGVANDTSVAEESLVDASGASTDTSATDSAAAAPEPAQEPVEAPAATEDPQGDDSITAPADQPVTPVPPAPTVASQPAEEAPAEEAPVEEVADATVALPAVEVVNLVNGENADLASLAKPGVTLVWFWAPH